MVKIYLGTFPGEGFRTTMDEHAAAGKKYPLAQSYMSDDKENSGFTFREDVTFKAGDKVDITIWKGETKNGKTKANVVIEDFESAWERKVERDKNKAEKKQSSSFY